MNKQSILLGTLLVLMAGWVSALPITITEQQQFNFGKAYIGANSCDVDFNGTLSGNCIGTGKQALIQITADPNTSLSVSVSSPGWVNGLRLTVSTQKKFSPKTNGAGIVVFPLACKLQLQNNITGGAKVLQYTITVNYQ